MTETTPSESVKEFYRFYIRDNQVAHSISDDYEYKSTLRNFYSPNPKIILQTFTLVRETPKGYWIKPPVLHVDAGKGAIWVSKTSRKRYAYPTKEEALSNLVIRTARRLNILQMQASLCQEALFRVTKERELLVKQ